MTGTTWAYRAPLGMSWSEGLLADDNGVASIVTALVTDNDLGVFGEQVGELALSFVAPLGSDHYGRGHFAPPDLERFKCCRPIGIRSGTGFGSVAEPV
jgi:hypothetical protein